MARAKNSGKLWTKRDIQNLSRHAKENVDTDLIAKDLGRSKAAVYTQGSKLGISFSPSDKK